MTKYILLFFSLLLVSPGESHASMGKSGNSGNKALVSKFSPKVTRRLSIAKQESAAINLRVNNKERLERLQYIMASTVKNPILGGPGDPRYEELANAITNAIQSCAEAGGEAEDATDYLSRESCTKALKAAEAVGTKYMVNKLVPAKK